MRYASVCSGVEAASLAWEYLGWKPVWFSEIEPFPCEVLKQRFPNVPNLGDMTKIKVENLENGDQRFTNGNGADVVIPGGIDLLVGGTPCQSFSVAGKREGLKGASGLAKTFVELLGSIRPRWFVWENVPGCLSSKSDRRIYDFNFLLAAFAECGYSCGWRILDAQYVRVDGYPRAVPQRRRRVFVIGHSSGDWRYPAEVLFEQQGLFGDSAPRRTKGKGFTADVERSIGTASTFWNGNDFAETLKTNCDRDRMPDNGKLNCVIEYNEKVATSIGNGQVDGLVNEPEIAKTLNCMHDQQAVMCYAVDQGAGKSQCSVSEQLSPTFATTHGGEPAICEAVDRRNQTAVAIAENIIGRQVQNGGNGVGAQEELAYTQNATGVMGVCNSTVRRLIPVECERLMGFPDNWTRIPWKGKSAEDCPDAPRYKACGNSFCVNVVRWIGMQIDRVERMIKNEND